MKTFPRGSLTNTDRQQVAQAILDLEKDLKENHVEINKHRAAIVWLDNKQHAIEKTLAAYRSLLSPVHKLPSEILSNTFAFFCGRHDTIQPYGYRATPHVITLSRVCARWREVAHSTPSLWSSMEVAFDNIHHPDHDRLLRRVQLFLSRSKAFPLDLWLQFRSTTLEGILMVEIPALQAIVNNCRRWRYVTLEATELTLNLPIFQHVRGCFPILEHLEVISVADPEDLAGQFPIINTFDSCPSLTSLVLEPGFVPHGNLVLPWAQIQSLSFYRTGSGPGLSTLSLFPNVKRLDFRDHLNRCPVAREVYQGNTISSKLASLFVLADYQHEVTAIFDHLTLPCLDDVMIRGPARDPTWAKWDNRPLHDFLARSGCVITSLTLAYIPITDQQTVSLLQLLPTLKKLSIHEYPTRSDWDWYKQILTQSLIQSLSLNHDSFSKYSSSQFLPCLTHLSLKVCSRDVNQEALAQAILSRWLPDPEYARQIGIDCLQSVSIILEGQPAPVDSLQNLVRFRDVGMYVEIKHSHGWD